MGASPAIQEAGAQGTSGLFPLHPERLEVLTHQEHLFFETLWEAENERGGLWAPEQEAGDGRFQVGLGHEPARHEDKIIHLTDYLYRIPQIRDAHKAYLEMRRHRPDELRQMQDMASYEVGDTRDFHVYNVDESNGSNQVYDRIAFELREIGVRSEIWVERDEYVTGKVDDDVVSAMMEAFENSTPSRSIDPEQGIITNNIDIFAKGNPELVPDPDGSGKVKILIVDIQDGWDSEEGGGYVAGFFNPGDLSPATSNPNSNQAAVLYIDSYPGIYSENRSPNPNRPLNTVAHEFQHLIQAEHGYLITFMDEGQSEIAEIFNGFDARVMSFLDNPDEVSGDVEEEDADGFLRWRSNKNEVSRDYERAQLFHSYLYERVGVEIIGSLTQSSSGAPWTQYQRILDKSDQNLELRNILAEFYVANWLNNRDIGTEIYGYSLPQLAGVRVSIPGRRFANSDERPWISNEQVHLRYGSAMYTHWPDIEDLSIYLDTSSEILHYAIVEDDTGNIHVVNIDEPEFHLAGKFNSVVLVSVNSVVVLNSDGYGSRAFSYSAEWTTRAFRVVDLNYAKAPIAGYYPVPRAENESTTIQGVSLRVDPEYDGELVGIEVRLAPGEEAVQGTGTLRVSVTNSTQSGGTSDDERDAVFVPAGLIAYKDIDFEDLNTSLNSIDLSDLDVSLEAGQNYHLVLHVMDESEDAELRFLLDQGSDDKANNNYYPVRTLLAVVNQDGDDGWARFSGKEGDPNDNDNKNLDMTIRLRSYIPVTDEFPGLAVSKRFKLLSNYPNPFNTGTMIPVNIPVSVQGNAPVRIDLYDITGRHVTTLLDGHLDAGVHHVPFEAENLASGIYIVRLQAEGSIDARQITLIK